MDLCVLEGVIVSVRVGRRRIVLGNLVLGCLVALEGGDLGAQGSLFDAIQVDGVVMGRALLTLKLCIINKSTQRCGICIVSLNPPLLLYKIVVPDSRSFLGLLDDLINVIRMVTFGNEEPALLTEVRISLVLPRSRHLG